MREASSVWTRRGVMTLPVLAAAALAGCAADPGGTRPSATERPEAAPEATGSAPVPEQGRMLLLASLANKSHVAVIDPASGGGRIVRRVRVGAAPWGVGVDQGRGVGYAATAEGLAVIDLAELRRTRLVRYRNRTDRVERGEYRPGGLGLAVAPAGDRVYVATTSGDGGFHLEVYDAESGRIVADVPVGLRPFDVLVAPDGEWAATVDHDSFTVTVLDASTLETRQHRVAPFGSEGGLASWEKAHYGAVDTDGTILLPYQGRLVARLDPGSGEYTTVKSRADSHAHGTALAGSRLLTVGTGAFGNATGRPNLSILDLDSGGERVVPLARPHETVAVWIDGSGAEHAAIAGGNTRNEGWDGVTLVDLETHELRTIDVPGYPQAITAYRALA